LVIDAVLPVLTLALVALFITLASAVVVPCLGIAGTCLNAPIPIVPPSSWTRALFVFLAPFPTFSLANKLLCCIATAAALAGKQIQAVLVARAFASVVAVAWTFVVVPVVGAKSRLDTDTLPQVPAYFTLT